MEIKPTDLLPVENAADFVDALRKLSDDRTFSRKKPLPQRRMRDKYSVPLNQEKEETPVS